MAVTPFLGPFVRRHVLTRWSGYFVTRALLSACRPNPLPLALNGLPAAHVLTPASLLTMASEVRAFNADMSQLPNVQTELPVSVLFGDADRVIDPDWHIDFLASRFQNLKIHRMPGVGHMPHHIAPEQLANMLDEMDELTRAFDKRPQAVA
jgi:pimeloyl-ACP methyl ester carboxylesterase